MLESTFCCREAYFIKLHQLIPVHFLCLIKRDELDGLGGRGFVGKRSLDFGQVVCADGNEGPVASEVGMQFVLESDKRLVSPFGEFNTAENGSSRVRSYFHGLDTS